MIMHQFKITNTITNRSDDTLDRYLKEIGQTELLTPEEEASLAQRIRKGDRRAQDRLITANLRFVVSVAKQYQGKGLELADLINEGNIGLIHAAEKYDETRGFKFISYAVWWIRQSIQQAIAEQSHIVRVPVNKVGEVNRINKLRAIFEQQHERRPNINEIAEKANMSEHNIKDAMTASTRHFSVDAPVNDGSNSTLLDILPGGDEPSDYQLVMESLRDEIRLALTQLKDREQNVLKAFYGIDEPEQTLAEIGDRYGMSRERTRQVREKAVRHLRSKTTNRLLRSYLG